MPAESFLAALQARGVRQIRRVRFRDNRHVLLSVSRDRVTLNAHRCFEHAPRTVLDAIAVFLKARRGSPEYREALERIRRWPGGAEAVRDARRRAAREAMTQFASEAADRDGVDAADHRRLRQLYNRLNESRFGGRLPTRLVLRLSRRMQRRFGQVHLYDDGEGGRTALELGVNVDLLLPGNERELEDTLLHEMAHMEAWIRHGDRGHGAAWKRIAARVGCQAEARTDARIRRRRRSA